MATSTLAAKSARAEDIFEPFPRVARQQGSDELALDPAKEKAHLPIMREVLSNFPSFEQINHPLSCRSTTPSATPSAAPSWKGSAALTVHI